MTIHVCMLYLYGLPYDTLCERIGVSNADIIKHNTYCIDTITDVFMSLDDPAHIYGEITSEIIADDRYIIDDLVNPHILYLNDVAGNICLEQFWCLIYNSTLARVNIHRYANKYMSIFIYGKHILKKKYEPFNIVCDTPIRTIGEYMMRGKLIYEGYTNHWALTAANAVID